jgi:hypothetical protein
VTAADVATVIAAMVNGLIRQCLLNEEVQVDDQGPGR